MQLAYRAASLPDAQIIADLLHADGIETRMLNQNAQSVAGEIPPAVAGPQIWVVVDEQLDRARKLIAAFQSSPSPGTQRCPRCGEENPSNFLTCWSCGGAI
jgi:hypothetical protein